LDTFFYWLDIDVLDTNKIHVFNGASAFISVLIGEIEKYSIFHIDDSVIVARIKHPISKTKNDRSYAILLNSGGFLTDTSGWLIFLDCGTDYSGSGGYLTDQIEKFLERYEKEEKIVINEISVPSNIFRRYLKQKRVPTVVRSIKHDTDEIIRLSGIKSKRFLLYQEIQNLEEQDTSKISDQINKIIFFLRIIIPNKPEYLIIIQMLDQIHSVHDISDKLEIVSSILPFIPQIVMNEKLQSIESKLNEIEIKVSPGISGKLIMSSGINIMGTGAKYEVEIPLSSVEYPELTKDMNELVKKGSNKFKELPEKLKRKLFFKFEGN